MRNAIRKPRFFSSAGLVLLAVIAAVVMTPAVSAAQEPAQPGARQAQVTFTKDVAPILQRSCQVCHRPGSIAPMSLLTYEEARPWARSMKERVSTRDMPPWHIDRNIGITKFKNDPSLSDAEIATIVKWVDSGTPKGNMADMPPARQFADLDQWNIGKPDLIATSTAHTVPAAGPDWWGDYTVDSGLTEDRYFKAIETKAGKGAHFVVHHVLTYMVEDETDSGRDTFLNEYALGKNGDVYPDGAGKLLKAGAKIRFSFHYHPSGEETTDRSQVGFVFYPKGVVPKHVQYSKQLGRAGELDIPAGASNVRHDGYTRLNIAAKITGFQPHLHFRAKRQCLELIYPDDRTEMLSCTNFQFAWHIVYNYTDDVAPIVPAGTILHVISYHDNSALNKANPDPKNWIGGGSRGIDEMAFAWISWYDLTNEEYKQELDARKAKRTSN